MNIVRFFDKIEEYLCAFSLAVMVLINFGNVVSRYIIHASWSFAEEILIIMFVWCVMLATAIAFKRSEHLGLSVLTDIMPKSWQKICIIISGIITSIFVILLIVIGFRMVQNQIRMNQLTPVLMLPEAIAGFSIPIGSILILFRAIQSSILQIKQLDRGE